VVELEGQRAGGDRHALTVDHAGRGGEQLPHPDDPAARLLEAVHVPRQPLDGVSQHGGVADHHEHRPDGERAPVVEHDPEGQRRACAGDEHGVDRVREDRRGQHRASSGVEPVPEPLVEAPHGVAVSAVGLDVRQARQAFLQEGAEIGAGEPGFAGAAADEPAAAGHVDGSPDGEAGEQGADPPVLAPQDDKHADEEQRAARHMDDEPGEEAGDGRHVALDPLDELARAVLGVERVVQHEQVPCQIGPQCVGGPPADVLGHVGLGDHGHLGEQRHGEEGGGDPHEGRRRRPGLGAVDEDTEEVGVGQSQPDPRHEEEGEQGQARPLGSQVGRDEVAIEVR
jgi:hypothetical protein